MILSVYVIYSPNNNDNIFLNKGINRILKDIYKTDYEFNYVSNFNHLDTILFAENVDLIKTFIDKNNLINRKCVAITQEGFHETTEETYIKYNTNDLYIYCPYNGKFNLHSCYNYYGIPGGKVDISNKTKNNYNTDLIYFGNLWVENWYKKYSLYKKRAEIAINGKINGFIKQIYSRDFYSDNINNDDLSLINKINILQKDVIKNVNREEKLSIYKNHYYSLEFLPVNLNNFCSERPFDAIISGTVPVFLGHESLKVIFPTDSIIYIDEFNNENDCFEYIKSLTYEDWLIRYNKCLNILHELNIKKINGDSMILDLTKNIVYDLFN